MLFLSALTGCGEDVPASIGETYEVKGRILLSDGRPLTTGRVTFVSSDGLSPPASGDVGAGGNFSLSTQKSGDGAVPGQYKVRIEPSETAKGSRPSFPLKYIDEDSSGLIVTVQPEPNQLEPITLK